MLMIEQQYEIGSPVRAILALLVGALTGGILAPIVVLIAAVFTSAALSPGDVAVQFLILGSVYAFVCFATGLALIGVPAWLVLHGLGLRRRIHAASLGVVLTFGVTLFLLTMLSTSVYSASSGGETTIVNGAITAHGWIEFIQMAALISMIGGIVGLTIWSIAYRRVQT
jgi:hypothetical protein